MKENKIYTASEISIHSPRMGRDDTMARVMQV